MVLLVAWIVIVTVAAIMISRRPIQNCPECRWQKYGRCEHPKASQVPELFDIRVGHYRCPWKEVIRRG